MSHRIVHVNDLTEPLGPEVDVAVVVDVLRAFTVAPWCLARGASRLLFAPSIDAAVAAGHRHPGAVLLKDGAPDPRFDLPNAPGRIETEDLTGRTVLQKTGNGTRGAHASRGAVEVLCASFVTAGATAQFLRDHRGSAVVVVTRRPAVRGPSRGPSRPSVTNPPRDPAVGRSVSDPLRAWPAAPR